MINRFDFLEWRKGLLIGSPDDSVSRGWIPYRLAIPTLLDEKAFVKWILKMLDLASFCLIAGKKFFLPA